MPGLVLENGSGLSRQRAQHRRRTRTGCCVAANASKVREEFVSSLAVAAIDGTVERRFQNGTVAGQALLKTGSLEGVRALAGYVIDRRAAASPWSRSSTTATRRAPGRRSTTSCSGCTATAPTWDPALQR